MDWGRTEQALQWREREGGLRVGDVVGRNIVAAMQGEEANT
jgi:hypothetical protein